jgi:serine/threonine-protein kinase
MIGSKLAHYEITAHLGSGGMGDVYQATDTKLGRSVAIKFLPEAFSHDSERVARFQHEARVLASLNHPNIAAIYGLEESGNRKFLVMELVDGETLAQRIKRGRIPVEEALQIGKQICEALQAAHDKGIVHRDLKPANIVFTAQGQVKVLDFGLSKVLEEDSSPNFSTSPTRITGTAPGVILGTVAYMSPEQATGDVVDKRTDIWAFGCVLYEVLTGKSAFSGASPSDTLATVLTSQPNWSVLPSDLPPMIRALLERTLEKVRARRIADISTAQFLLSQPSLSAPVARATRWRRTWIAVTILLTAGIISVEAVRYFSRPRASGAPSPITWLTITPSLTEALTVNGADRDLAISPDGTRVAWVGNNGSRLFIRALDRLEAMSVGELGTPRGLFFSPDGQSIGFFAASADLRTIASSGEPVVNVTRTDGVPMGASWGPDGSIVYATTNVVTGIQRVSATGGEPTVLTRPNRDQGEADHRWPHFLPGGGAILFTIATLGGIANSQVAILDLKTGAQKTVLRGATDARYVSSGYLVYAGANGGLWAVEFDLGRMETAGTPVLVLPQAVVSEFGAADFDVAQNGTLVYATRGGQAITRALVWVDRQGREEPIDAPPREYLNPRISPDGSRVLVEGRDGEGDIWMWDFASKAYRNQTLNAAADRYPVWTPDGRRMIFTSDRDGAPNLFWQAVDGSGTAERLTTSRNAQFPTAISPDGSQVVFHENFDLMTVTLGPGHNVRPLLATSSIESNGDVSPDGRWLAYQSNESGRFEIRVRPFPAVNSGQWQVSSNGGVRPVWSRDGHELFYLNLTGTLMSVPIESGSTLKVGKPTKVIDEGKYLFGVVGAPRSYDVSPDGKRFLMIKPIAATTTPANLVVVQNWLEELKQRVPVK